MRREEINNFVSTNVVRGLREHNLDLVDFLCDYKDDLLGQSNLATLRVMLRERNAMIKLLADKILHINDEELLKSKKHRKIIGIQTSITESDRAQSSTDYIPTKWKSVRFFNYDTGKIIKEFWFVEGNPGMENVVEYWKKVVKGDNPEKMIKFFHADDDSNELI